MRRKINQSKYPEMTQVIELINKDIQAVMIVFLMFKKLEERLNVLSRDIEDIKRRPKLKI